MRMLIVLLKHLKRARLPWLEEEGGSWRAELERDQLSHPSLKRMNLEQLADLPFERHAIQRSRPNYGVGRS